MLVTSAHTCSGVPTLRLNRMKPHGSASRKNARSCGEIVRPATSVISALGMLAAYLRRGRGSSSLGTPFRQAVDTRCMPCKKFKLSRKAEKRHNAVHASRLVQSDGSRALVRIPDENGT